MFCSKYYKRSRFPSCSMVKFFLKSYYKFHISRFGMLSPQIKKYPLRAVTETCIFIPNDPYYDVVLLYFFDTFLPFQEGYLVLNSVVTKSLTPSCSRPWRHLWSTPYQNHAATTSWRSSALTASEPSAWAWSAWRPELVGRPPDEPRNGNASRCACIWKLDKNNLFLNFFKNKLSISEFMPRNFVCFQDEAIVCNGEPLLHLRRVSLYFFYGVICHSFTGNCVSIWLQFERCTSLRF